MAKKIENNFYDRFMALKPDDMSEGEWFNTLGYNKDQERFKRSEWKRIEKPDPETVEKIHSHFPLTAEQIVDQKVGSSNLFGRTKENKDLRK